MLKMVKQSAIMAKVPVKNELDELRLNFFMNTSTSDKFCILETSSSFAQAPVDWPLLMLDLSSIKEMVPMGTSMSAGRHLLQLLWCLLCLVPEMTVQV
ncbi:uncharacterized protein ACA1_064760 [Acanthamoeba castellanii str. Neff]|uniref:Uncharacterized protein n=1 Tax=Acanthamoeba castellanii (strain ATCC 30010 / Neff) TaxID=1257118 RepID=L8GWT8_ACACF|nr:uncharacterized protein ACA1_064760 [Acanthamoeba castellanii str. Neff]ELR17689.1 hypothetical protein ACA1_064760 [Acanthamoeba castellanii str. Neff]